ncbi:unnamed protein product [Closterium sp. Naga37s-1]|nr:unnamed protein product [Closterium sp. Naga37s-1]
MSEECNDVYLPKGKDTCWPWIDPSFPCNVYEDSIWLAFQKYLLAEGRWAMESSKSRYHAAETLKIEGPQELKQLVMGQLIHVVQLSVTLRVVPVKPWDEILKVAASPSEGATGEERSAAWEEERPRGSWRSTPRSAAAAAAAAAVDVVESPVSSPSPMSWRRRQKLQEFRDFAARVLLSQPHGIQLDQLQRECARKMPRGFNSEALGFASLRDVLESMKNLARLEAFPGGFVLVFASDELKGANLEGCSSPLARAVPASPSAATSATSSDPVSAALPSPNLGFSSHPPLAAAGPAAAAPSGSTPSSALHPSAPTTPRASPPPVPKPRPEGYRRFDTSWGGESSSPFSPRSSPHSSSLRYREPPSSEWKPTKERALAPSFSSPLSPFTSLPSPRSLDASPSPRPLGAFRAHQRRPSVLGEEEQFGIKGGNQLWDDGKGWGEGKDWGVGGGLREEVAALGSPAGSRWRTEGKWREVREVRDIREVKEVEEVREKVRDEVIKGKQESPGAVHPEAGPFMQPALFSSSSTATSDASGSSSILKTPSSVSDAGVSTLRSRAVPPPRLELPLATIAAENVTEGSKGNLTESSRSANASAPAKGRAADGGKARASHKAELMRSDLRQLLQEVLSKPGLHKTGYQLAFLKGAFLQKYAYPLDHTVLGYPKLKALLLSMEDVVNVAAAPGGHGTAEVALKEVVKAATHWQVKAQHVVKGKEAATSAAPAAALSAAPSRTAPVSSPLSACLPEDEHSVSAPDPGSPVHEQPMEVSPIVVEGTEEGDEGSPEVAALVLASLERKREGSAPVATHADEDDVDARERAMEAVSPDTAARLVPCANAAKSPEPGARESIQSMWDEELSRAKCAVHGGDCQGGDDGCAPALKELSGGGASGDALAGQGGSVGVPRGVQQLLNEAFSAIPVSSFPLPPGGEVVEISSDTSILEAVRILSVHRILSAPVRNAKLTGAAAGSGPRGAAGGGVEGAGGAGGAGLGLGSDVAWSDRYLGMVDYAGVMMWVLQQAGLAAATLTAGTAALTGAGVGVVGALGAAALGVGGAPLAMTGVAAAAVGAAVARGLRERRKLGGRGGGAAAAADSLGVDFFHMITENEPFKSATVADITRSYRWAPFLPLQPTDSMLTLLLLLSRFRMRSVPVVALALAPPAPRLHNLITQSAVVRGLARCRGFDWFDVIADKPLMTLGLPLVGEKEVVSVDAGALVLEAFLLMKEKGVGGVPVTDGPDRILYANISARDVGLLLLHPDMFHSRSHLTVRDFVDRCLALQAAELHVPPASSLAAADLSATTSTTPTPTDASGGVSGTTITTTIPPASTAGGAIGKADSSASDNASGDSYGTVGSMRPAVSCRRTDSLVSVIETLAGKGIHRMYVTDDHGRLQGVVTLRDIISRFVTEPEGYFDNFLGDMARAWE